MKMDQEKPQPDQAVIEQVEDFVTGYANNIQLEPSSFDLKMVFGELSQTGGRVKIEQHTSITISWIEAKLLIYFLQIQIAGHELQHGKIRLPKNVLPAEPGPVPPDYPDKATGEAMRQMVSKMREEFLAEL